MSGPKVINVEALRRQQKRRSLAALHRLERAIAACERLESQPAAIELLERLHRMRDAGEWALLANEAPRQLDFYQDQLRHLGQQHAESLRRAHQQAPATAASTLEAANALLAHDQADSETSRLRQLASSFTDPQATATSTTLPPASAHPHEHRLEACWELLGQLASLEELPTLQTLITKAEAIRSAAASQRPLLLDSLALELSALLQHRRALAAARDELEAVLAEISPLEGSVAWSDRITAMLAGPTTPDAMRALVREAQAWADAAFAEETRREQRSAVLRALAIAGYEVREGMTTAWAENGRIVLQKPDDSQYGIEVSAPPLGNAFQTRVVAFNESGDPRRDLEIEQTWCGEFQKAREMMESDGFQTTLVQAHEAGTIPLKRLPPAAPRASQQEVSRQRSL